MGWTIKQISRITGIPADTLRYYEREGIISPRRHENGYRHYDETDITILKYIVVMKYARFSLSEIKSMTELFGRTPEADCTECNEICNTILNAKIVELKQAISNYQMVVRLMEELLPMVQDTEAYYSNERDIEEFISRIFDDIQSGGLLSSEMPREQNRKG